MGNWEPVCQRVFTSGSTEKRGFGTCGPEDDRWWQHQGPAFEDDMYVSPLSYFLLGLQCFTLPALRFTATFIWISPTIFNIVVGIHFLFIPFVILSVQDVWHPPLPEVMSVSPLISPVIFCCFCFLLFLTGGFSFVMTNSMFRHMSIWLQELCRTDKEDAVGMGWVYLNIFLTLCLYPHMLSPLTFLLAILCPLSFQYV